MRHFLFSEIPRPEAENSLSKGELPWPVNIEIGAGVGLHAIQYSGQHPERKLIAFERTKNKFAKFQRRHGNHQEIENLLPIHGDAIAWISHYIPPKSVEKYFILYPNPYPKGKHANLRFANMPFMEHLISTMTIGGTLTLATNELFYAEEVVDKLVNLWKLELCEWIKIENNCKARTHFEKKYLDRGQICHNLVFKKPCR